MAVADYVEGKISVPPLELKYALQASTYNLLPNPGGLRDQPAGLMAKMGAAINVYRAFSSFKSSGFDPKWISGHPDAWEIIGEVEMLKRRMEENKAMGENS